MTSANAHGSADSFPRRKLATARWSGIIVLSSLVVVAVAASTVVKVDNAIAVPGTISVSAGLQSVAHPLGGTVSEILVRDGDAVNEGDPLIELVSVQQDAVRSAITRQSAFNEVKIERLRSEASGGESFEVSSTTSEQFSSEDISAAYTIETAAFSANRLAEQSAREQSAARVEQLRAQERRTRANIQRAQDQISDLSARAEEVAVDQTGGSLASVDALDDERDALLSQEDDLNHQLSGTLSSIAEEEAALMSVLSQRTASTVLELENALAEQTRLAAEMISATEASSITVIRAPISGVVFGSMLDTVGGVAPAGATLMQIVPASDELVVEAQIQPNDIDVVQRGQRVRVQFSAFNQNKTPQLFGEVAVVDPGTSSDPSTGTPFYSASIKLDERQDLPLDRELQVGMPASVFIETGERTILSYLLKPLADQLQYAFIEE